MKKTLLFILLLLPLHLFAQFIIATPYAGSSFCRATKNNVLLSDSKTVWHPVLGIDVYAQSNRGYEFGLGYSVERLSIQRMSATYNIAKPMHNIYLILGTGHVDKNLIVGAQLQLGTSIAVRQADEESADVANYSGEGTNIALKITVGTRLSKNYGISIQPAVRSYNIGLKGVKPIHLNKFYGFEATLAIQRLFPLKNLLP